MSRLMGIVSPYNIDDGLLLDFRALAEDGKVKPSSKRGHRSGWGIGFFDHGRPTIAGRGTVNAFEDTGYVDACRLIKGKGVRSFMLAYLRKDDSDEPAEKRDVQPFAREGFLWMHNGGIIDFRARVSKEYRPETDVDSERYFSLFLTYRDKCDTIKEALHEAVEHVKRNYDWTSLTCMFSDGKKMYAYRDFQDHDNYYTIHYGNDDEKALLVQEPRWGVEWNDLEKGHFLTVDEEFNWTVEPLG